MRILLIHNYYRWRGGEDIFFDGLQDLLRTKGHSIDLFAAYSDALATTSTMRRAGVAIQAFYSGEVAERLRQRLQEFKPDVVHVQNVFPLLSPSVYSVIDQNHLPLVHTIQNFRFVCPSGLAFTHNELCLRCQHNNNFHAVALRCLHGSLSQSALYASIIGVHRGLGTFSKKTGHLLPVNRLLADTLRQEYPAAPMTVLPNFIDTRNYALRIGSGKSIVYLGRLSEEKGLRTLLRAIALVKDVTLDIIGDGPLRAEIEASTNEQIRYHGFVKNVTRFNILRNAAALVMPSLCHDACPLAVLEAFACGVPVIASRRGGLPDLVADGENGILVEAGNAAALADAAQRLVNSPTLSAQMGAVARRRAEQEFDISVYYQRLIRIYEQVITATEKQGLPVSN